jgi:hypothetical protein
MTSIKADIVDGITHFVQLAVDSLSTYALTVGKTDKPAGITVYDEDTGAAYCMKVKSGVQVSAAGACGTEPLNIQPLPANPPPPTTPSEASSTTPVMQEVIPPDVTSTTTSDTMASTTP